MKSACARGLHGRFSGWRSVRADGNCYYRCLYFNLLEQLVVENDRESLATIVEVISTALDESLLTAAEQESHEELLRALEIAVEGGGWSSLEDMEADFLDSESGLDVAFVRCLRHVLSEFIMQNSRDLRLSNDQSLAELILTMSDCR